MKSASRFILLTREERVSDAVGAAAAAHGVHIDIVTSGDDCLAVWAEAPVVLVGGDQAAALASLGPKERSGVYLVGFAAEQLARWSVPLSGQVIVLPEGVAALSAVLADDRGAGAPVVTVVGGSGGVGASTVAFGMATVARRRGQTVALVDLDPLGGGIDLLLGAERTPGWRWPDLLGARGEVTDVRRFVPQVDGLTVVSMGRAVSGASCESPSPESVKAVLGALRRHHDLVIVDVGRLPIPAARPVAASCHACFVVTGCGVRSVAATASVVAALDVKGAVGVVRLARRGGVSADVVGRILGLPIAGVVPDDRGLRRAAELGEPPGRVGRRAWKRAMDSLIERVEELGGVDGD